MDTFIGLVVVLGFFGFIGWQVYNSKKKKKDGSGGTPKPSKLK